MDLKLIRQMAEEDISLDSRVVIALVDTIENYEASIRKILEKIDV